MPRRNRYYTSGRHWHVTHRCHDREFLLKYAKDRDEYQEQLRVLAPEFGVHVLGYCLTSNHVHMLFKVEGGDGVPALMKKLAGQFAQAYNLRKGRSGAYWGDRYHATLVDTGDYLWRCLQYIDLNIVRAGVVRHCEDWAWCGYKELTGAKKRYRLINIDELLQSCRGISVEEFRRKYVAAINEKIARRELAREAYWASALAVGSDTFVRTSAETFRNRKHLVYDRVSTNGTMIVRESA